MTRFELNDCDYDRKEKISYLLWYETAVIDVGKSVHRYYRDRSRASDDKGKMPISDRRNTGRKRITMDLCVALLFSFVLVSRKAVLSKEITSISISLS